MTNRTTRLGVDVVANDQASKVVRDLADDVDDVEGEHEVDVTVDGDQAVDELAGIRSKLDQLSAADREIALKANAQQLEAEIRRAEKALGKLDRRDGDEIELIVEAKDNASKKLDAVQAELRALDGATATVDVEAKGLDDLTGQLDSIPGKAGDMGKTMTAALTSPTAAVGALVGGMILLGNQMADRAIEAQALSNLTGDSVEQASRLQTVWSKIGDTNDLSDVLLQMGDVLSRDVELAERLGLNMADGATTGERFVEVIEKLGTEFDNAGERSNAAASLFGEEGVRQVNALITRVGDLGAAIEAVPQANVSTADDVDNAIEFKKQLSELTTNLQGLGAVVGQTVVPIIVPVIENLTSAMKGAGEVGESFGRTMRHIFDGGAAHAGRQALEFVEAQEAAAAGFDRQLIATATSGEQVRAIAAAYGLELEAQMLILAEWGAGQRAAAGDATEVGDALQYVATSADLFEQRARRANQSTQRELNATKRAAEEADEAIDALFDQARSETSAERALFDLVDGFDRVRDARAAAFEAVGTKDAEEALRNYRLEQLRLTDQVTDYLETIEDLPFETVTRIRTLIDDGEYATVLGLLDELAGDRISKLVLELDTSSITREPITFRLDGSTQPLQTSTGIAPSTAAPVQYVTIYNPPGTPAATAENVRDYDRRNGPR